MIGALGYHTHILYFLGINHRGNLLSGWIDGFVTAARKIQPPVQFLFIVSQNPGGENGKSHLS